MRFSRTASGRLNLDVTDAADYAVARRLAAAILETFRGKRSTSLTDVDGSAYLDVVIAGATVTIHLHRMTGICVFAAEEAADGVICDVANWLGASAAGLGIAPADVYRGGQ
jgi:hypothetical protein